MTDLYIATPTQADYDALMRLAEAAGYEWYRGKKPTALNFYNEYVENGGQVVHFGVESKALMHCDREYFEKMGATIETIPNLANIKAIWKVSRENRNAFTMKHRLPPHYKSARKLYVICDEYSGTYATKENEIYEALAVEYKPQESEDMPEKVKLPKFMCTLIDISVNKKITTPELAYKVMEKLVDESIDANKWLGKLENRWKLLNALHYGYEPEPEQLYYVRFIQNNSRSFLNSSDSNGLEIYDNEETEYIKTKFTMSEILAIDPRYKAFAVPVEDGGSL